MQSLIELSWTSSHLNWQSLTRLLKFYLHLHLKTWKIILYVLYCYFSPVFYTEWNLKIGHYRIQPKVRRKRNSPSFPIEYPFTVIRINDVSPDERRASSIIVLKFSDKHVRTCHLAMNWHFGGEDDLTHICLRNCWDTVYG